MELTFTHDVATLPQMLQFNYDELKTALQGFLQKFEGLVITEDATKQAEADRAAINKTRDAIKNARIRIKKDAFDAFEAKCKELEAMCDKTAEGIAEQLREFERVRKEKKLEAVKEVVDAVLSTVENEGVKNSPRIKAFLNECWTRKKGAWQNAGVSLDAVKKETEEYLAKVNEAVKTLESFLEPEPVEVRTVAEHAFNETFEVNAALDAIRHYKDEAKRIAEARAREEARAAARKAEEAQKQEQPAPAPAAAPVVNVPRGTTNLDKVLTFTLKVTAPKSKLCALREYMNANGITFENVK